MTGLRISAIDNEGIFTIRVEGRLDVSGIPELQTACQAAGAAARLDLAGLLSADDEAVRALRDLVNQGAELTGASPYIRQLLSGSNP